MNTMKTILYRIAPVMIMLTLWAACKDEEAEQLALSRQFKPANFVIQEGETSSTVGWAASLFTVSGEVQYQIEVSKDLGFSNVEVSKKTSSTQASFLDTEIQIKTDYYARVKALGKDGTQESKWSVSAPFKIKGENFTLPTHEYDLSFNAAFIRWQLKEVLVKMIITKQDGTSFEVTISQGEYESGGKLISGLTETTSYTAEVFTASGLSKGSVSFKTKSSYSNFNVIDLTGITGKPKILRDTLQDIPSGSVVWLKRGEVYTIDNTDLSTTRLFTKSVTIMSAPELNQNLARINLTTNFNFTASAVIDSLVFRDLVIKGVRAAGASFDNDYLINSNVTATVSKIRLENCKLSRLRGTVRLQAIAPGTQVANYFINNCALDSIREFAVVMASGGSAFAIAKISNSTFTRCRRFVNHSVAGNNSLVVENCTFNELPTGAIVGTSPPTNYFIDFGSIVANVQVKNCILGKTWIETAGSTDAGGIRAGATSSINVTNTYTLSDFISTVTAYQIPGSSSYSTASTSVFTNPAAGDFSIKDAAFPGKTSAGDPRWR
jgi:hypothetical protein